MPKIKFKQITVSLPPPMMENLEEVVKETGVGYSEAIRVGFNRYYNQIFRSEIYGYQAGSKNGRSKGKKQSIDDQIATFEQMSDSDATEWLNEIGYILQADDRTFAVLTNEAGLRVLRGTYTTGGFFDAYIGGEFTNDIKKFLKKNNA